MFFLPFQYTPPTHLPSRGGGDPFLYKSETILIRLEMKVISESIGKIVIPITLSIKVIRNVT